MLVDLKEASREVIDPGRSGTRSAAWVSCGNRHELVVSETRWVSTQAAVKGPAIMGGRFGVCRECPWILFLT